MTDLKRFTFPKSQRLTHRKTISELFKSGRSEFLFPFKVFYQNRDSPSLEAPQVLIGVSKRSMRRAVDRNLFKRRIREIYRQHKTHLCNAQGEYTQAYVAILYVSPKKIAFNTLQNKLIKILGRLKD